MDLQVLFTSLELEPKEFIVGDTIRVTVSFQYTIGTPTTIVLQAVPYQYIMGILDRIGASAGQTELLLAAATIPKDVTTTIDFTLTNISSGTYGLLVEILGTTYYVKADSVLIIAGAPPAPNWISMMMMLMMMGMVVSMVGEG